MTTSVASSWLALQCQMIPNVERAVVTLRADALAAGPASASWPDGAVDTAPLLAAGALAESQQDTVVTPVAGTEADTKGRRRVVVACPLVRDTRVLGVVAMEVPAFDEQQHHAVIQLIKWGSGWLDVMLEREAPIAIAGRLATVVEATATTLEHERFQAAATAAVTQLAATLSCSRVSFALHDGTGMRVRALSHTADLDGRANLVREIEAAMDEAADEGDAVIYPAPTDGPVQGRNAHELLARGHRTQSLCTIPIAVNGRTIGALTFERAAGPEFDRRTIDLCDAVAAILGPVLDLKRREDRWIGTKVAGSFNDWLGRLLGPRHPRTKAAFGVALALVAFMTLATGTHRVGAAAVVEGAIHRALVAPVDGFIESERARAGDVVAAGALLATLDDGALVIDKRRRESEVADYRNRHRRAVATLDLAEARILEAQIGKARAQLALIDEQLARTRIVAPFAGLIISGDLSRSRGAPIERGQVLFEIAPLDNYRMVLQVDEGDIARVAPGQSGALTLAATPGERHPFVVEQVVGVAGVEDGRNTFRVEARLEGPTEYLRPGMKGVAKVDIEARSLLWIWTHELRERVALWLFSTLP